MILKDEGYVLSAKKYSETALIVTLFTLNKGKITAFVTNGTNKKNCGLFQPSNKLFFETSVRLEENMRRLFRPELIEPNAVSIMTDAKRLELMSIALPMMQKLLNENEDIIELYNIIGKFFSAKNIKEMLTWYAYFEFYTLEYLGLGLSLECCAVTGKTTDLAYISPKTGKAVCREVGQPYKDRLFMYPHFIVDKNQSPSYEEIFNVLKMTEFFLTENFFKFHNLQIPQSRSTMWRFYDILQEKPLENKIAAGF